MKIVIWLPRQATNSLDPFPWNILWICLCNLKFCLLVLWKAYQNLIKHSYFVIEVYSHVCVDAHFLASFCFQFLRMQGKKHRGKESINIVDVNADDFISTVDVHKSMTEEQPERTSHKKGDGPSSQQKRKHQITYLAHQVGTFFRFLRKIMHSFEFEINGNAWS